MALLSCTLASPPTAVFDGATISGHYSATYIVRVDAPHGPLQVLALSRAVSQPDRLPGYWEAYDFSSVGDPATQLLDTDVSSFAQVFRITNTVEQTSVLWTVQVEWHPQQPGQPSLFGISNLTTASPVIWLERAAVTRRILEGKNVQAIRGRSAGTQGPIHTSIGVAPLEYPEIHDDVQVLAARVNLASLGAVDALNRTVADGGFRDSTNNATFYDRPPGFCRFVGAFDEPVALDNGVSYVPTTIRIELGNEKRIVSVNNVGQSHYAAEFDEQNPDTAGPTQNLDESGVPVHDLRPLTIEGLEDEDGIGSKTEFEYLTPKDYASLLIGTDFNSPILA